MRRKVKTGFVCLGRYELVEEEGMVFTARQYGLDREKAFMGLRVCPCFFCVSKNTCAALSAVCMYHRSHHCHGIKGFFHLSIFTRLLNLTVGLIIDLMIWRLFCCSSTYIILLSYEYSALMKPLASIYRLVDTSGSLLLQWYADIFYSLVLWHDVNRKKRHPVNK